MQLPQTLKIVAGKLFDPYSLDFLTDQVIQVSEETGLIIDLQSISNVEAEAGEIDFSDPRILDLREETVLPGFVDAHVHLFLHPYSETSWDDQLTKETLVERTVRATNHAKATLLAGFTSVRDLGTEGAGDADIALRKCLSGRDPLIPGPRYFCSNRAIVTTGSYGPKGNLNINQEGVDGITGAEAADGVTECRQVVRRQIGAGADWIKIYADYRYRSRLADVASRPGGASMPTFLKDELRELVDTAHAYGVKIAAHATSVQSISALAQYGVDTIEHGYDLDDDTLDMLLSSGVIWVPTLAAYYSLGAGHGDVWERAQKIFRRAVDKGVKIACGGDTGVFAHGQNALEMKLMVRLGADWKHVLKWATLGGWECVRSMDWEGESGKERIRRLEELREEANVVGDNEMPFGVIRKGFAADIIATTGNLEENFENAVSHESISFVMKGGKVLKRDGLPLM